MEPSSSSGNTCDRPGSGCLGQRRGDSESDVSPLSRDDTQPGQNHVRCPVPARGSLWDEHEIIHNNA